MQGERSTENDARDLDPEDEDVIINLSQEIKEKNRFSKKKTNVLAAPSPSILQRSPTSDDNESVDDPHIINETQDDVVPGTDEVFVYVDPRNFLSPNREEQEEHDNGQYQEQGEGEEENAGEEQNEGQEQGNGEDEQENAN